MDEMREWVMVVDSYYDKYKKRFVVVMTAEQPIMLFWKHAKKTAHKFAKAKGHPKILSCMNYVETNGQSEPH